MSAELSLLPTTPNLSDLIDAVRNQESPLLTFVSIGKSDDGTQNAVLFESHDDPVKGLTPFDLFQLDRSWNPQSAGTALIKAINQGFEPNDNHDFVDILLTGDEITVVPGRHISVTPLPDSALEDLLPKPNAQGYYVTLATVFGLTMEGKPDPDDPGIGSPVFGRIKTGDPNCVGAAIPTVQAVLLFGTPLSNTRGKSIEVTNIKTGQKCVAPIVDFGPGTKPLLNGVALDLTYAVQRAIGGDGKVKVMYRFV